MNSIAEHITPNTIANQIRLERSKFAGSFLLLEGDNDARLFKKFIDTQLCSIEICHNRGFLFEVLSILDANNFEGVLGFADQDYAKYLGFPKVKGKVVYTDFNDIEISILSSPALNEVITEYGTIKKAQCAASTVNSRICDLIFNWTRGLGALRLLSHEKEWALKFQGMKYKFSSKNCSEISLTESVRHILSRTNNSSLNDGVVEIEAENLLKKFDDFKNIVQGHDCIRVLGKALNFEFGCCNDFNSEKRYEKLAKVLRLAFSYEYFKKTKSFSLIKEWELQTGYKIMKD